MTSRASIFSSEVKEDIASLDDVGLNGARRPRSNGDIDDLSDENQVWVSDFRVGGNQALESDLVVCSNGGEGVSGNDDVESGATEDGSCVYFWGLGHTGGVVWEADLGGNGQDFA